MRAGRCRILAASSAVVVKRCFGSVQKDCLRPRIGATLQDESGVQFVGSHAGHQILIRIGRSSSRPKSE